MQAPTARVELAPRVQDALAALGAGQCVLLYDADGREEETDLVVASGSATPEVVRRFRTAGGGLICTTLHSCIHERLGLPYLSDVLAATGRTWPLLPRLANGAIPYEPGRSKPSFSLSVNHRQTYTGVTDNDRSRTIQAIASIARDAPQLGEPELRDRFAREFRAPGHVFLLNAHPRLLEGRRGHTELATALVDLAGLAPTATICEMMNGPSGRALPKADAIKYARQNGLVFLEGREVFDAWTTARTDPAT